MSVRAKILRLLHLTSRRLERLEDARAADRRLLEDIRGLLVQLSDGQQELRSRLIEHADRQGQEVSHLRQRVTLLERLRPAANGAGR